MNSRLHTLAHTALILAVLSLDCSLGAADENETQPFVTDALGRTPDRHTNHPAAAPSRSTRNSRAVGSFGDVDGDGEVEIVSARNVDENDNHFTSAAVAHKLDGTVLWTWGDPKNRTP